MARFEHKLPTCSLPNLLPNPMAAIAAMTLLTLSVGGLAGCDDATSPTAATQPAPPPPKFPIQSFAGAPAVPAPATGLNGPAGDDGGRPTALNDPSAPSDTPLCGRAARETNAIAAAISPTVMAEGGTCLQTACFDPLTDTFIGADGYRHVCQ